MVRIWWLPRYRGLALAQRLRTDLLPWLKGYVPSLSSPSYLCRGLVEATTCLLSVHAARSVSRRVINDIRLWSPMWHGAVLSSLYSPHLFGSIDWHQKSPTPIFTLLAIHSEDRRRSGLRGQGHRGTHFYSNGACQAPFHDIGAECSNAHSVPDISCYSSALTRLASELGMAAKSPGVVLEMLGMCEDVQSSRALADDPRCIVTR